jgi:hypothetical protein
VLLRPKLTRLRPRPSVSTGSATISSECDAHPARIKPVMTQPTSIGRLLMFSRVSYLINQGPYCSSRLLTTKILQSGGLHGAGFMGSTSYFQQLHSAQCGSLPPFPRSAHPRLLLIASRATVNIRKT